MIVGDQSSAGNNVDLENDASLDVSCACTFDPPRVDSKNGTRTSVPFRLSS